MTRTAREDVAFLASDASDAASLAQGDGTLGDGLALSFAAAGASLVGMLSWIVAAHALTPAELGTATAFVSAFLLVAGCTELNLGVGLLRWLPGAGSDARRLLRRASGAVAGLAGLVAVGYLLLPGSSVIVDAVVGTGGHDRVLGGAVFVVAAVGYALLQQQDFVLVGLRRPWWAPVRTIVFAVGRLGLLLAAGAALTTTLVVASWVVPTLAVVGLATAAARWRTREAAGTSSAGGTSAGGTSAGGTLPARREVLGFLGPTYLGQVATSVLFNQVPLLVVMRYGTVEGASFFLVWQAVTVVDVLAQYFTHSLAAGVAREPGRAAELSRAVRRRLLVLIGPALGLGALLAEPVLALFGPHYAGEAPVLRVLLAGLALRLLVVHRLGEHQAFGRGLRFARLSVVTTALVLAAVVGVGLLPVGDPLMAFAVAFVVVQALCAVTVTVRRIREEGTTR